MQEWDKNSEQVTKITPDKEKAKSLLKIISLRERNINKMEPEEFSTLIVEGYYEIVKELITAIMSADGWKTVSHEMLIGYMAKFYKEFYNSEIYLMDQLRKTRNDIAYRGVMIKHDYLKRNGKDILKMIERLKIIAQTKIR